MKSILIIDTPKGCGYCQLSDFVDGDSCLCRIAERKNNANEKPKWCPLRPMPLEQDIYEIGIDEEDTNAKRQWNKGWNACLKEIEK